MSTEVEFGGVKFTGGKMFVLLTALSTLGGAAWGGFEVYKDYMDMKEIISNIDTKQIEGQNTLLLQRMDEQMIRIEEAIEYTRDIKSGLRDDILGIEKQSDRVEDMVREAEERVRKQIEIAEGRFENKRDQVQNEYAAAKEALRVDVERKLNDLEGRLNSRLQRALDNPLAQ
jgi:hypothetical protein